MASLEELVISLRADSSRVENALNSIENRLGRLGSASEQAGTTLQNAFNRTNFSQLTTRLQQVQRAQENVQRAFNTGQINVGQYQRAIQPLNQLRDSLNSLTPSINRPVQAVNSLSSSFSRSFSSASSLQTGLSGLGSVVGTLLNPVTLAIAGFTALAGAFTLGVKSALDAGVELERQKLGLAGLINATTQFSTAQGKALTPQENLNASVEQAGGLFQELRKQAILLADIDTNDLLQASQAGLVGLGKAGITNFKEQADVIGTVTAALKQLKPNMTEAEKKFEIRAFLGGDFGNAKADFASLIASVNGGAEAFKKQYDEAVKNGTAYEFLREKLSSFKDSAILSADTVSNKFSVISESADLVNTAIGSGMLPAFKSLQDSIIGNFWEKQADGSLKFKDSILQTAESIGVNLGQAFTAIEPIIKPVFDIILNSIELVGNAIGAFAEAVGINVQDSSNQLQGFASVIDFVGDRIGGLVKIVVGGFQIAIGVAKTFAGAFTGVFEDAINLIIDVVNKVQFLGAAFQLLSTIIIDSVAEWTAPFRESVVQTFNDSLQAVQDFIQPFVSGFQSAINWVANKFNEISGATSNTLNSANAQVSSFNQKLVSQFQGAINAVIGLLNGLRAAFVSVFNNVAGIINNFGGKVSQMTGGGFKPIDLKSKLGLDAKSVKAQFKSAGGNISAGFGELFNGRNQKKLPKTKGSGIDLSSLTAGSKGGGAGDSGKKAKGKKAKGDGLAGDRNRLALLNEEGVSLEKQAQTLEKIFAKKKSILAESIKNNALTLKQAQDEANQDVGKERRNLEQETALSSLEVERAKIEQAKALGLINEKTASQKLTALDQEKIKLEANFAAENARIETANKISGIEKEKAGIQEKLTQLIQDSNLKEFEKLATLDATREKLNGQITALQGQKDKFDDIKKLQNELLKNDLERKKVLGELSLDQANKLSELETELGKKNILIEKEKELLGIKQKSIGLQASNKSQLESISAQTEINKTKFQGLKDLAKGFGDNLKSAFEEGKFNAEKFFNGMIELLSNFATKAIETLFSAGGQGGGGGGILGSLFSSFGGMGGGQSRGGGAGFSNGAPSDGGYEDAGGVFHSWSESLNKSTQNLDTFSLSCSQTDGSLGGLGQGLSGIAGTFGSVLQGAGQQIGGFAGTALSAFGSILSGVLNAVMSAFGGGGGMALGFATGGLVKAATGGYISGSGTGTSDSIPAMLSNGEYVINAKSTEQFMPLLNAINTGKFKGFSNGGVVMKSRGASANGLPSSGIMNSMAVSKQPIININAMDSQDVIRALTKKDVRKHLFDTSNNAVQTSSNKAFNRSTMEFSK